MTITLEQQIDWADKYLSKNEYPLAILASLKRLQEIEKQEVVGHVNNVGEFEVSKKAADKGDLPCFVYALPVSPLIPEGYRLVPIEPTEAIK